MPQGAANSSIGQENLPQNLSLFPEMHIDIVLEVLGHLHPLDLMHVARANKAFRDLLLSSISTPLWRAAFVGWSFWPLGPTTFIGHSPPKCPTEICGRRWAKLLFGPRMCDKCGLPDTAPDYTIWRRLCSPCMNIHLYNGVPNYSYSHEVNTLLARTYRTDGASSTPQSDVGRLWPADGTAVADVYERLKAADAEATDELKALPAFIQERKEIVEAVEARARETGWWSDHICNRVISMYAKQTVRVYKSARKRLIEEGHDPRDVITIEELPPPSQLEGFPRLTSKRWNKARPYIVPLVHAARDTRLQAEHEALIVARRASVTTAISQVLRTAPPQTWAYNPPGYTLETLPALPELIHDPSDAPLADDDPRLLDALLALPAFVEAWRAEKRALLASLLPALNSHSDESACAGPDAPAPAPGELTNHQRLELATSVFTCLGSWVGSMGVKAGRSLIGWTAAGAHLRCRSLQRYWQQRVHFTPEGAAAAAALVRLVGLDPTTTTAVEMDAVCRSGSRSIKNERVMSKSVEKRFVCMLCTHETHGGVRGRRAMQWRECVAHTIERVRSGSADVVHRDEPPAWALLTDAAVVEVRWREAGPDPVERDSAWMCTLCTAHFEARVSRPMVIAHLMDVHRIREPEEGRYFMHFEGSERTPRVPGLLSEGFHTADLRCVRCPEGKLRSLRAIGRHVADKHGVTIPSEKDWTKVELILRSTPMDP
ncbi:hypothetical protein C8F04DRAFT_99169 [Mycena alexandri]|uniref:F-box domain-containing protein n=1 Tax=Mycena alexandri TaxID=1745969 RepID=A0AAD6SK30_9AGAR|nr:hypothetical protein C8F04DRAFT_99169 [Mycena alexandri]